MSESNISDKETSVPQAPGPANPSLDRKKVNPESQHHGAEYLEDKSSVMNPEALLNRFKELSETDDPTNAILVTEVQEVKEYLDSLNKAATITMAVVIACAIACVVIVNRKVNSQ